MTREDSGDDIQLLNQPMAERVLNAFSMAHCKPIATLLPAGLDLSSDDGTKLTESTSYRQLVVELMHLDITVRPDVAFAVHYLHSAMDSF